MLNVIQLGEVTAKTINSVLLESVVFKVDLSKQKLLYLQAKLDELSISPIKLRLFLRS